MATFATTKTRILSEVNRSSTTYGTLVGDCILSAIQFYEKKPVWFNKKTGSVTVLETTQSIALPSDFMANLGGARYLYSGNYVTEDDGFREVSYDVMRQGEGNNTRTGNPEKYAIEVSTLYVTPIANADYAINLHYVYRDTLPSADGDSGIWLTYAPDLIRVKAMEYFYRDVLHSDENANVYEAIALRFWNNLLADSNRRMSPQGMRLVD